MASIGGTATIVASYFEDQQLLTRRFTVAYGANDVDGIAAVDTLNLGPRRTPLEDIARQIRAAGAVPVERDARYQVRG